MNLQQDSSIRDSIPTARLRRAVLALGPWALAAALATVGCGSGSDGGGNSGGSGGSGNGGSGASGGSGGGGATECESSGGTGEMVSVPAGAFLMGCNASVDNDCKALEKPSRQVTLKAFQIDKTEVTQDQYAACIADGACNSPDCDWDCNKSNYPAGCVTWADAKAYCAWAGKRLPTEAEWEKAARGTDGRKYPWGNTEPTCELLNMEGCKGETTPAGAYPSGASFYGALDMGGNMVEMVADYYDETYYQTAPTTDPTGPASGTKYVGRGGGFKSKAFYQRNSQRDWYVAIDAGASLGFRCAK